MNILPPDGNYSFPEEIAKEYENEIEDLYPVSPAKAKILLANNYIVYHIEHNEDGCALNPNEKIDPNEFYGVDKDDWNTEFLTRELYGKCVDELENLSKEIRTGGVEEALERAYEFAIKGEISEMFSDKYFNVPYLEFLLEQPYPLDYIYREWIDNDLSIRELLVSTVEDIRFREDYVRWRDK